MSDSDNKGGSGRALVIPPGLELVPGSAIRAAIKGAGLSVRRYAELRGYAQWTVQRIVNYDPSVPFNKKKMMKDGSYKYFIIQEFKIPIPEVHGLGLTVHESTLQPRRVSVMTGSRRAGLNFAQSERGVHDLPLYRPRLMEGGVMALVAGQEDRTRRPHYLFEVGDAYAIDMIDDSMAPKFDMDDRLFVSPTKPIIIGKPYVFWSKDRNHFLVRILAGFTADVWQITVAKEGAAVMELPTSDWPHCERVISTYMD